MTLEYLFSIVARLNSQKTSSGCSLVRHYWILSIIIKNRQPPALPGNQFRNDSVDIMVDVGWRMVNGIMA